MDDTRPRSRSSRRYGNASKLKKGSNFGAGFEPKLLSGRQGLGNGHGLQGVIPQSDNSSAECGSDHSEPRTLIGVEVASSRGFSDSSSMETVPLKAQLVHISEEIGRLTGAQAAIQAVLKERSEVGSLRATLDAERSQWARQEEHLKSQLVHYEHEAKEKEALIQQLKSTLDAKSGHVLQLQQELAATQQLVEQRDTALRLREAAETQSAANLATVLDKLRGAEAQQAQQHEAYDRLAKQLADTEGALADKDAAFKEYEASMQESLQKWEKRVQEQDTWNWRMQQEMVGMDQHYQGEVMKIIQERDRLLQELHQARASAQGPVRSNGPPNGVVQFGSDGSRVVESGHRSVNPELERLLASAADPASMQQVAAVGSGSYLGSVSFFAGTQQGVTTNDTPSQSAAQPTSEASASATANGRSQIGPGVQASSTSQSGQPRSPAKASAAAKASGTSNGVADKNAGRAPQSTPAAAKEVQHKGSTPSRPSSARENVADNGATAPQRAFRSRKRSGQAAAGAAQAQAVH
ncbi:hypothetical protein WJX72_011322 [[Myrmecia] bisecta]|uniref:Uncharacterized protein n=1 Tax=[Myrmecia] bisecta TaxID=41462 RepID=A0AAW1PR60_9CHLO